MARRLVQTATTSCDWHGNLPEPEQVDATTTRRVSTTKELDLCGFCALVWDMVYPRKDELLQMLRDDVIEALLRAAHSIHDEEPEDAKPRQLAIHEEAPTPAKALEPAPAAPATKKRALSHRRGVRVPGVEQVICPLPHRRGTPNPYWVKLRDRGSHAKSSHQLLGPQVHYELPDASDPDHFTLDVKCFEHKVCAEAGGFGFKDEAGRAFHVTKAKDWEPNPDKDAPATADKETTAPPQASAA